MSSFLYSPAGSLCVIPSLDKWTKEQVLLFLKNSNGEDLCQDDVYFVLNGRLVASNDTDMAIKENGVLRVQHRLIGGKGGFGSMLRAIGAQIEKTTSREACRDLSGRRMRDVNDEKKITEWVAKQAERERELAQQKQERLERRRATPKHNFDDQTYTKEIQKNLERIDDALKQGLKTSASITKRKGVDSGNDMSKKRKMWMDEIDSDEDDEDAGPSTSSACASTQSETNTSCDDVTPIILQQDSFDNAVSIETPSSTSAISQIKLDEAVNKDSLASSMPMDSQIDHQKDDCVYEKGEHFKDDLPQEAKETSSPSSDDKDSSENNGISNQINESVKAEVEINKVFTIDEYNSPEELESIGLDALKEQLMVLGLKCGGTLQERAVRLFQTKGKSLDELDPSLFSKPTKGKKKNKNK